MGWLDKFPIRESSVHGIPLFAEELDEILLKPAGSGSMDFGELPPKTVRVGEAQGVRYSCQTLLSLEHLPGREHPLLLHPFFYLDADVAMEHPAEMLFRDSEFMTYGRDPISLLEGKLLQGIVQHLTVRGHMPSLVLAGEFHAKVQMVKAGLIS